jgi:holin-like protein
VTQTLKALGQLAVLWLIYRGCDWFVTATGVPVPATVLGVVLLFLLLLAGVVKLGHVQDAADLLLKHLVFFFVPIAVGLMEWGGVFADHGVVLLAAILVSTAAPFVVIGLAAQRMQRGRG